MLFHLRFQLYCCLFVCLFSGPATDDKHCFDCLFVVSTINLLGPGRVFISSSSVTNNDDYNNYDNYEDYDDYHNYDDDYDNEYNDYDDDYDILCLTQLSIQNSHSLLLSSLYQYLLSKCFTLSK